MFCSCFGSPESASDFEAHNVRHHFFDVGLAHDMNPKHRESMEDAHVVKVPFMGEESTGFFAIYDGHGGSEASLQVSKTLHSLIEAEIKKKGTNTSPTMRECFEAAYATMDEQLKPLAGDPGTTAVTCLLRREGPTLRIYVANAGDARAVLCRSGRALRLSYDHKPSDDKERQRIAELGGFVTNDRVNGILAVSRALGDHPFKKWVVSTPFWVDSDIVRSDSMLLLACDGLWDVIDDQEAVDLVRGPLSLTDPSDSLSLSLSLSLSRSLSLSLSLSCSLSRISRSACLVCLFLTDPSDSRSLSLSLTRREGLMRALAPHARSEPPCVYTPAKGLFTCTSTG